MSDVIVIWGRWVSLYNFYAILKFPDYMNYICLRISRITINSSSRFMLSFGGNVTECKVSSFSYITLSEFVWGWYSYMFLINMRLIIRGWMMLNKSPFKLPKQILQLGQYNRASYVYARMPVAPKSMLAAHTGPLICKTIECWSGPLRAYQWILWAHLCGPGKIEFNCVCWHKNNLAVLLKPSLLYTARLIQRNDQLISRLENSLNIFLSMGINL